MSAITPALNAAKCAIVAKTFPSAISGRPRRVGTEFGFAIFQERCMNCHGNPDAPQKAPEPAALRQMMPEAILDALTTGVMRVQSQGLSDEEKRQVAESLSGRPLGTATDGDASSCDRPVGVPGARSSARVEPADHGAESVVTANAQPTKTMAKR